MESETKSNIKIAVIAIVIMVAVFFGLKIHNEHDDHGHSHGGVEQHSH